MAIHRDKSGATFRGTTVFALLIIGYVLSYAPVYRLARPLGWASVTEGMAVYRPVDWLIDNTPLDDPLFRWAACWNVSDDFVWSWVVRAFERGETNYLIDHEIDDAFLGPHIDLDES